MITKELVDESDFIRQLVDIGKFDESYQQSIALLNKLKRIKIRNDNYFIVLANIAGTLVDIGQMQNNKCASELGCNLIEDNKEAFISVLGECLYYYNYGNALSNLVSITNPNDHTFKSIEELVSLKNIYWRSFKLSSEEKEEF